MVAKTAVFLIHEVYDNLVGPILLTQLHSVGSLTSSPFLEMKRMVRVPWSLTCDLEHVD